MFFISRRVLRGRSGKSLIITGIVLVVIGLAITVGSYAWASSRGGGSYYVSFSPIIIGIIAIVRGVKQSRRGGGDYLDGPAQGIPQSGYGSQQPGYGAQPGYGTQTGYGAQAGYGAQTGYGAQAGAGYGGQAGPGGPTGYGSQAGYGGQGEYGMTQDSGAPRAYDQPGYATPHRGGQGQGQAQAQGAGGGAGQPGRQPAPNWYPDPRDPSLLRWWNGQTWTADTQPRR
ncbi:MAG TPA: DUF2510 domain-containing protein [Trebonia sp.]